MKKLSYFIFILCIFVTISCKTLKETEIISNTSKDVCNRNLAFGGFSNSKLSGTVLDRSLNFLENNTTIFPLFAFVSGGYDKNANIFTIVNFKTGIIYNQLQSIGLQETYALTLPSMCVSKCQPSNDFANFESFKNAFCNENYLKIEELNNFTVDEGGVLPSFVFSYSKIDRNDRSQSVTYFSALGKQTNSSLKVIDLKEIEGTFENQKVRGILATVIINCSLYGLQGEYKGDVKNLEMNVKVYQLPK